MSKNDVISGLQDLIRQSQDGIRDCNVASYVYEVETDFLEKQSSTIEIQNRLKELKELRKTYPLRSAQLEKEVNIFRSAILLIQE